MRYGSCKINSSLIDKLLCDKKISGKEIDVLLWIALRQDEFGRTFNIKYYEVCQDTKISNQEFYNCIEGLEKKNIIRLIHRSYAHGWDIEILDNVFSTPYDDKKRYLNINRDILFSDSFLKLRANEKKLCLKLLLIYNNLKDYYLNIEKISEWLQIKNMQLIRSYINSLKRFFNIRTKTKPIKDKNILIIEKHNSIINSAKHTIFYHFIRYKLIGFLRRFKIKYDEVLDDLIILINQYKEHEQLLYSIMIDTIKEKGSIEPKLINSIVSNKIKALNLHN